MWTSSANPACGKLKSNSASEMNDILSLNNPLTTYTIRNKDKRWLHNTWRLAEEVALWGTECSDPFLQQCCALYLATGPDHLQVSLVLQTPTSQPCAPAEMWRLWLKLKYSIRHDVAVLQILITEWSLLLHSPVPISVTAHSMTSPDSPRCFHQSHAACQWHPGNKVWGCLHQLS